MPLCDISYLGQRLPQIQIQLLAIFAFGAHAKKDFVAANNAAVNLPLSVCSDLETDYIFLYFTK